MQDLLNCFIFNMLQVKNLLSVDPGDRVSLRKMIIRKIPR